MNPSPFDWNTGQPSILAPLQVHANIAKKASDSLSAALGTRAKPVRLAKKAAKAPKGPRVITPNRAKVGKTRPLDQRLDFDQVREYRLTGKSWREVAEHFGCCLKAVHERATSIFPELRGGYILNGKRKGAKPMPMPLEQIAKEMMAGASLRGSALKHGFSHVSLRYRLMQIPAGVQALQLAKVRADGVNAQKKAQAHGKRNTCYFHDEGDKARKALR